MLQPGVGVGGQYQRLAAVGCSSECLYVGRCGQVEQACVASQACLKLAALCTGYADKFMAHMTDTHELVVRRLTRLAEVKSATHRRRRPTNVFRAVATDFFSK